MHNLIKRVSKKYCKYFCFLNELLKFEKTKYNKINLDEYEQNKITIRITNRDYFGVFQPATVFEFKNKKDSFGFTIDKNDDDLYVGYIEHGLSLRIEGIIFKKETFNYTWKNVKLK